MRAALAGESGIGGFPWRLDDYGERMITLPGEVDGRRVLIGCDVVDIEDVQDSLATFGDRYLRKVFTAGEIDDCQVSEITSLPNALVGNRNHLPNGSGTVVSTGYTACSERGHHQGGVGA